jgi:SAM-dependent methyltransferase
MTAGGEPLDDKLCPACLGPGIASLPDPWRGESLLSDLRTTAKRLGRVACLRCGLVRRGCIPSSRAQNAIYGYEYSLFAQQTTKHVRERQARLAAWILEALGDFRLGTVFEVGCGDGSLLDALSGLVPAASYGGIDPAPQSVAQAQRRGLPVTTGFAEDINERDVDLCLSVNVIEHIPNPVDFLRAMRRTASTDGRIVVVCPDGDIPNYELLFYDHLYSFDSHSLASICARADLTVLQMKKAPPLLGPFQMVVACLATDERPQPAINSASRALTEAKAAYLRAWSRLEEVLLERVGNADKIVVFGNSDVAALLSVYAPLLWARVEACVVDGEPTTDRFIDRPLRAYSSLPQGSSIVLGVRPGHHDAVACRLEDNGHRVVRWNDVVAA